MSNDERHHIAARVNDLLQDTNDLCAMLNNSQQKNYLQMEIADLAFVHRQLGALIFLLERERVDLSHLRVAYA